MANLILTPEWTEGIYQLETSDLIIGGPDGVDNRQAIQLGKRTEYLKQEVEKCAPRASPEFTGRPKAPTPAQTVNDTTIATTAFVKAAIAALVGSAPAALDTLTEIATALGGDGNLKATLLAEIGKKLNIENPILKTTKSYNDLNNIPDGTLFFSINETTNNQPYYNQGSFDAQVWQFDVGNQQVQMAFFNENDIQLRIKDDGVTWSAWRSFLTGASSNEFTLLKNAMIGVPFPYPAATVPSGCLALNGQSFSKTIYPELAKVYPLGKLPDLRGEFIRGWDNARGVDGGRALLSLQNFAVQNATGRFGTLAWDGSSAAGVNNNPTGFTSGVFTVSKVENNDTRVLVDGADATANHFVNTLFQMDLSNSINTASETRPRNVAFQYICLAK